MKSLVLIAALGVLALGCNASPSTCDRSEDSNPPIVYADGAVVDGVYSTSAPTGPLLYFPGGIRYQLTHHLGATPVWYDGYLSFSANGTTDATLAAAAGNQVEFEEIDDTSILVTNGACSEYWLLVVAGTK